MSKSIETTVAQNINATLTVEDIPMNENVTLAQLNAEAEAAAANETKEKKEKFSLTRTLAPTIERIEKAISGNASQSKALDKTLGGLLGAGLDTSAVLAKIDTLRKESVEITTEFEAEVGRALIEAVKVKNAQ